MPLASSSRLEFAIHDFGATAAASVSGLFGPLELSVDSEGQENVAVAKGIASPIESSTTFESSWSPSLHPLVSVDESQHPVPLECVLWARSGLIGPGVVVGCAVTGSLEGSLELLATPSSSTDATSSRTLNFWDVASFDMSLFNGRVVQPMVRERPASKPWVRSLCDF
jgi:hypothetical protein